jgi:hypothetical protein
MRDIIYRISLCIDKEKKVADLNVMRGGCHCGRIALSFSSSIPAGEFSPRACDCSFCVKHGAQYISDRNGSLVVNIKETDALGEHRFGHNLAKFLFCQYCGTFVAVLFETDGRIFGSVNTRCIEAGVKFGVPQTVSPQKLNADQKKERWAKVMIPDVQVNMPGA